jgi:hypothetical protein
LALNCDPKSYGQEKRKIFARETGKTDKKKTDIRRGEKER